MAEFFQDKAGDNDNPFQEAGFADIHDAPVNDGAGIKNFKGFVARETGTRMLRLKKEVRKANSSLRLKIKRTPM